MKTGVPHRVQASMPLMHNVDQALEKRVQRGASINYQRSGCCRFGI